MKTENDILTLVKIISILFFENMASDKNNYVFEEVREILGDIEINTQDALIGTEEAAVSALKYTADWMLVTANASDENNNPIKFSRDNILQRLKLNLHCENQYIEVAKEYLDETITSAEARSRVTEIISELRFERKQTKFKKLIASANKNLNFPKDGKSLDTATYAQKLIEELSDLNTTSKGEIPGLVGRVNFNHYQEIEEILKKASDSYSADGILKTGFQGLDKSTGIGGFRRGEMINFGANTHNYKSGILIDLALNIPIYNDPWMMDPTKKPMILRISFENTLDQDIAIMYKKLIEIETQEKCKLSDINTKEAAKYLTEHFGKKGYHFFLESYDPNSFTIYDLFDIINRYIQEGYEIHAISCDYLSQIAHNTLGDRLDSKIQKTYEMARNFCYPKGITFMTAHQLSTEAQNLLRENTTTFAKKVSTGGWYMDCKSLHTKLDLEYLMNIHRHQDGNKYLFISRGKHRGGESTPDKDCHFIRRFEKFGGIVPDATSEDLTLHKLPELLDVTNIEWVD